MRAYGSVSAFLDAWKGARGMPCIARMAVTLLTSVEPRLRGDAAAGVAEWGGDSLLVGLAWVEAARRCHIVGNTGRAMEILCGLRRGAGMLPAPARRKVMGRAAALMARLQGVAA